MSRRIKANEVTWKRNCYMVNDLTEIDGLYLTDPHGFVLEKDKIEELIKGLQKTLAEYDKLGVEEYNEENHQRIMEECESSRVFKPARKKSHGFIYVATYDDKRFKIGMTTKLDKRITKLSIEMPYELRIVHTIKSKDTWLTEKLFHEHFSKKRINGEWFELTELDLEYIKQGCYTKEIEVSIEGDLNG